MKCFMCKGEAVEGKTNHVVTLENGCIVIVKNVPCLRCKQCGESLNGFICRAIENQLKQDEQEV